MTGKATTSRALSQLITPDSPPPLGNPEPPEPPWPAESFDQALPRGGWIEDFTHATRGIETPTRFCLWSAVWALSSTIRRDAWLHWFPSVLYPNFYIIVVAPPRICPKTTAVQYTKKLILALPGYFSEPSMRLAKIPNIVSKSTPEALGEALRPKEEVFKLTIGGEEKMYAITTDSQAAVVASELEVFLGKQKYNTGLIGRLTDLYDCLDEDSEETIGRGKIQLKNIYLTIFGATTAQGIEESVPKEAMKGGFMSRVVMIHQDHPSRVYPEPHMIPTAPGSTELAYRLAWIAQNAQGEYSLSEEALAHYRDWYYGFKKNLGQDKNEKRKDLRYRYDTHLLKLSLLIRAQRYEPGREVTLADFQAAQKVLEETYRDNHELTGEVGVSFYTKAYNRVSRILRKRNSTRRRVMQATSPYGFTADLVGKVLDQLHQEGRVEGRIGNEPQDPLSEKGNEIYRWIGEKE